MSSFKRKIPSSAPPPLPGTKPSPGHVGTVLTSSGIASLDDLLGGGLPLGCNMTILAPEPRSAYGSLVVKYAIAQGLAGGQKVIVVDGQPDQIVRECMWLPKIGASAGGEGAEKSKYKGEEEEKREEGEEGEKDKIKIAWRYEGMKQFRTTVDDERTSGSDDYCKVFDLTSRMPETTVHDFVRRGQLVLCPLKDEKPLDRVLQDLTDILKGSDDKTPVRICVPELGSFAWGDLNSKDVLLFLSDIQAFTRKHTHSGAFVSLAAHVSAEGWGGLGWVHKLGWMSDACITLAAFTADLALSTAFPTQHGFVHIHTLPAPTSLVPPSDRLSTLRGLGSGGENNLGFRCMRKRMVFETVHLDVEGGVGERRTTPATTVGAAPLVEEGGHSHAPIASRADAVAQVEVMIETSVTSGSAAPSNASTSVVDEPPKKAKKSVAFRPDRADLYDF